VLTSNRLTAASLAALVGAGALLAVPSAHALTNFPILWSEFYSTYRADYGLPTIQTDSLNNAEPSGCQLCHVRQGGEAGVGPLNPYGADWRDAWPSGSPSIFQLEQALIDVEGLDSDADPTGSSNLVEITASTQPGWNINDTPPQIVGDLDPSLLEPSGRCQRAL